MPLYFAYGSNLDLAQLADREVDFVDPQRCTLSGWKLVFNKVATLNAVPESPSNVTPVASVKPVPVSTTAVPPATAPVVTSRLVNVGVYANSFVSV